MNRRRRFALTLPTLLFFTHTPFASSWTEHASSPGPDVVAVGESRFDQLFRTNHDYSIPYPFEQLIESLRALVDNGRHSGVRQVFVPMGRSLQRDTPAPEYFRHPRHVIALEGEPVVPADTPGRVLEYRLFIAHQPATDSLEVISYNDSAGRFEFQVVENYTDGAEPRVRQANRVMCLSCHQNAAPIFPQRPWSETNFNLEVSKRLVEDLPQRFESLLGLVTLEAGAIDLLTERANYLSAAQTIWRQGCNSARCRAAMLRAVLQYRLSAESSFDSDAPAFRRDYVAELARNWSRSWPDGLRLANSRIPDRDPFADAVAANTDPLAARAPHATWRAADSVLARGIIHRLGGFFTRADIRRLDRFLIDTAASQGLSGRIYRADCQQARSGNEKQRLICGRDVAQELFVQIQIETSNGDAPVWRIAELRLPDDVNILQPDLVVASRIGERLQLDVGHAESGLSLRLGNGDRVKSLSLLAPGPGGSAPTRLEVEVVPEFVIIDAALAELLESHAAGLATGLERGPFRRALLLPALLRQLQMPAPAWPPERAAVSKNGGKTVASLDHGLALLMPYCGHCHADASQHPPGFLQGPDIQQNLAACAPRMLARLAAWQQPGGTRPVPMPPPASMDSSGLHAANWPHSDHFRTLLTGLEDFLDENNAELDWRNTDYERLPPCQISVNE